MKSVDMLSVVVGAMFLVGCNETPLEENMSIAAEKLTRSAVDTNDLRPEILITNVVRVFFHEPPYHYSVMSRGASNRLIFHDLRMNLVEVFEDVPPDLPMWVVFKEALSTARSYAEIHLHDSQEINGAGWTEKRGKTTYNGTTASIR